jgi:WD40 repeat protein
VSACSTSVRLWNIETFECLQQHELQSSSPCLCVVDQKHFLCSEDLDMHMLNVETESHVQTFTGHKHKVTALWLLDDLCFLRCCANGTVCM